MPTPPARSILIRSLLPLAVAGSLAMVVVGLPAAHAAGQPAPSGDPSDGPAELSDCTTGPVEVADVMAADDWAPVTPSKWEFPGDEVILAEAGTAPSGPRRPFEYAVLQTGPEFGSVQIDAEVRLDTPVAITNRDIIIVFGYQSPTRFYYAHYSTDNTIYPHNGIFLVNDADRLRIDDQWNGSVGAPPAITDAEWHDVRVRHCSATGEIAAYVDGASEPFMTATDTTLHAGRVGFGSFDNIGRMRDMVVTGTPGCRGAEATIVGTGGADYLSGTSGDDVMAGLAGDDVVRAGAGDDVVCGGDGDDVLIGQGGIDTLAGEAGSDQTVGGPGEDVAED